MWPIVARIRIVCSYQYSFSDGDFAEGGDSVTELLEIDR